MDFGQLNKAIQYAVQPQMVLDMVIPLILVVILVPAAMIDLKEHRIPNPLSLSGWLIGPMIYALALGLDGLFESLSGLGIVLLLSLPLWLIKWMGAGDVKLMTGVGAMVGADRAIEVYLGIVVTGLIMGVALLLLRGQFILRIRHISAAIGLSLMTRSNISPVDESKPALVMPYAIAIAFGTLATLMLISLKVVA